MGTNQIKNLMSEMKFYGMAASLDQLLTEAQTQSWSHTEFLDALIQDEYGYRENKKTTHRLRSSKLKLQPAFEDFDFTANRSISKSQIKELYHLKWMGRPIVLIGQTGVGKTFIAQAIGTHACHHKYTVLHMKASTFLEELMLAKSSGTYLKFKLKLSKPHIFILDDFGLRKFSSPEAEAFCELLEDRSYGDKSTVITTQLPLENWTEVIEDPVIADAIIDRLKHVSLIYKIKGESYRKIQAKKLDDQKKGD
jgi:DNA replication protein DnaC